MKNFATLLLTFCFTNLCAQQTVGLFTQTSNSQDGYVLFAPIHSDTTYLIDKCGKKIHQWTSNRKPGLSVYLLPNGELLRTATVASPTFTGSGASGGRIEKYDWNSNLIWGYTISDSLQDQNHDVCPMPNGNIIVAIWEKLTTSQAIAAGRNPTILGTELWSAKLMEIQPVGTNSANVIWQWRLWDHLVQDYDSTKINYGVVTDHPELLNLNFNGTNAATAVDWIHLNAVTYNAALDQVMFSSHNLSEIYIIDHSTSTAQATGHSGGVHNKGGDFLYRWGNAASYNRGTTADRKLYLQHNPTWIPAGFPYADKIMIFNNGVNRPGGNAASIDIIAPPVDAAGDYTIGASVPFAPATLDYTYQAAVPSTFFAMAMGGAQPLANGNIITCEATTGDFFEIDSSGNTVWDYINPVETAGPAMQGNAVTTNQSFRCIYYPLDYSGFSGQTLTPGNPIEINPLPYICNMNTSTGISLSNLNSEFISTNNPFNETIVLTATKEICQLRLVLYSVTGEKVCEWNNISISHNKPLVLPVNSTLAEGLYFISYSNKEMTGTLKLMKVK